MHLFVAKIAQTTKDKLKEYIQHCVKLQHPWANVGELICQVQPRWCKDGIDSLVIQSLRLSNLVRDAKSYHFITRQQTFFDLYTQFRIPSDVPSLKRNSTRFYVFVILKNVPFWQAYNSSVWKGS